MNLYTNIKKQIIAILEDLQQQAILPSDAVFDHIDVSPTREASHGDMATNAAMILAAKTGKKPKELAEIISERIKNIEHIEKVEIAGPGFINLYFKPEFWQQIIPAILKDGNSYGNSSLGAGQNINVEYVSANPTGPMHVGHGRGAVYGDALAMLLLKAGYNVTKEYYINDAGGQVDKLAWAAAYRYLQAFGVEVSEEILANFYPGDYLIAVGEALKLNYGNEFLQKDAVGNYELRPLEDWLQTIRDFTVEAMLNLIKDDLRVLGIEHDVFTSERKLAE
ncbi:MAG: arginine--tRNA ligase [Pseudomonadota bacterium]